MDYDCHLKQIVLGVLASSTQISSGMTLTFPSVALPAMRELSLTNNQSFYNSLQGDPTFWIVSLPQISMIAGCLNAGPVLDWKGRRISLLLSNLIAFIGWTLMASIPDLWAILTGRLLTGFAMGFAQPVVVVYVSEIASPNIRSSLTVANAITFSVGVTLTNLFGYFYRTEWQMVSGICGLFSLACFLIMIFILPEPKLRREKTTNKANFKRSEVYKPMAIMLVALLFRQLSGSAVILSYTVEMIEQADVIIDSYLVAVLVGLTRTVGAVFSVWLSGALGRRLPTIWSGLSMTICMFALATPFELPTFAFLMYILTSTVHASITQSMVGEVFPTDVRGVAASIAAVNIFLTGFLAIWIHQWLRLNSFTMFTYYGGMSAASTLFLFMFLPETHGKTLKEIESIFNKNLSSTKRSSSQESAEQKMIAH